MYARIVIRVASLYFFEINVISDMVSAEKHFCELSSTLNANNSIYLRSNSGHCFR